MDLLLTLLFFPFFFLFLLVLGVVVFGDGDVALSLFVVFGIVNDDGESGLIDKFVSSSFVVDVVLLSIRIRH